MLDQLPEARLRQRQGIGLDTERRQRRRDRIGDHTADRNDAALARAFDAERVER